MAEIKMVKYSRAETELVNLYKTSFGHDINTELWKWKHTNTSATPSDPEVIVAMDGDKIVGARPFLDIEMWLADKKVMAAQHCDTMVHPEYQKQGLFNLMGQFSLKYLKEKGYAISYGFPNQLSQHGFIKQGYKIISEKEDMFFILQPKRFMVNKWGNKLLGSFTGIIYDILLSNKSKRTFKLSESYQVLTADRFIVELSQIDSLRDRSVIDLVRNESFLKWRFDDHPEFEYKYIVLLKEGKLMGYAVFKVLKDKDGANQAWIMDYLVKDYDSICFQILLHSCLTELEKMDCISVHIRIIGKQNPMRGLFKRAGFRSVLEFPYNKFYHFSAIFDAIEIQDKLTGHINIYDKENWRVSYAFTDSE